MAKEKKVFEYYIREKELGVYLVAKFDSMTGGEQPLSEYTVKYDPPKIRGKCNCAAGSYRGTGETDKHVIMVQDWIAGGRLTTAIRR